MNITVNRIKRSNTAFTVDCMGVRFLFRFTKHGNFYRLRMTGPTPSDRLVFNLWLDLVDTKDKFGIRGTMYPYHKPKIIEHYCLEYTGAIKEIVIYSL